MKKNIIFLLLLMIGVMAFAGNSFSQDKQAMSVIQLPAPRMEGGKPLLQALKERQSNRDFSDRVLTDQVLSEVLWAAFGINRPESGMRTAPSAHNTQNIDVYVAMKSGVYLYDAKQNQLQQVIAKDIRAATGKQDFVAAAPVNIIYVADYTRMGDSMSDEEKGHYSALHTGLIAQNVYLYCASEGLITLVRGWVDKEALGEKMNLRPEQKIMLTQTVGYSN